MSSSETSFAGLAFLGDFLGLIEKICMSPCPKTFSSYMVGKARVDFSSLNIGIYSDDASVPMLSTNVNSPESLFS